MTTRIESHRSLGTNPFRIHDPFRFLVVLIALVTIAVPAVAGERFERVNVGDEALSIEHPAGWTVEPTGDPDRVTVREPWHGKHRMTLTVHATSATQPMEPWTRFTIESDLPSRFPGSRVESDIALDVPGADAHGLHIIDLAGPWRGYEMYMGLVLVDNRFVYVSMYVDAKRAAKMQSLFTKIAASVLPERATPADRKSRKTPASNDSTRADERPAKLPPDQIEWESDFDQAFARARSRDVPVMIAFGSDSQPVCEALARTVYRSRKIVGLSRGFVCLIASIDTHSDSGACELYGHVDCDRHRTIELPARERFVRSTMAVAPQHLFCSPSGLLLSRREYAIDAGELSRMMSDARKSSKRLAKLEDAGDLAGAFRAMDNPTARAWLISDAISRDRLDDVRALFERLTERKSTQDLADLLGGIGFARNESTTDLATSALGNPSARVRDHAAVALEQLATTTALPRLMESLDTEKSTKARKNLLRAIGACGAGKPEVVALLLREANRGKPIHRINAIIALRHFRGDRTVIEGLIPLAEQRRLDDVRVAAAWTLAVLGDSRGVVLADAATRSSSKRTQKKVLSFARDHIEHAGELIDDGEAIAELAGDEIRRWHY